MLFPGIGMGVQDSSLKAIRSGFVPAEKRSAGFAMFDTGFGIAWFVGSAMTGLPYGKSIVAVVIFSVALQLLALPVLAVANTQQVPGAGGSHFLF
jgi:hypothetical protein